MNKFFLITVALLFFYINGHAQDKWFSTAELDFIVPSKTEYGYSANNAYTEINLASKTSFALNYSINYLLFKKFSAGLLTGIQQQSGAKFFMYKLGSNIKYYFVDSDNVYTYLQYAHNFTVDKDKFNFGDNVRIGIGIPVMRRDAFNLNLNIFYDINSFDLSGSNPLVFDNVKPSSIYFRSYGISLGMKF
jgi:hypothetical protein